ncbi:MAG: hypothetical protein ABW318_15745, partial [Vicinamibacterales bacterium]
RIKRCVGETGPARALAAREERCRAGLVANRFVEYLTSHRPCLARSVLIDPEYGAGLAIGAEYGAGVVVVGAEYWAGLVIDGYGPGLVVFGTQYRPPCSAAAIGAVNRIAMVPIVAAFAIC